MSTSHNWVAADGRKSWAMLGSAKASTVLSMEMSSTGSISTASAHQWRWGVRFVTSLVTRLVDMRTP
ncbi:hypothetical protein MAUB1S_01057 [Mycolicibacterium aubagnense]